MSNLSVLPKILKLRSIKQIVVSNIRMLQNVPNQFEKSCTNKLLVHQKYFNISFSNRRLIHTKSIQWKGVNGDDIKRTNIDQFRAEEVKLEREEIERQKQGNQTNMNENTTSESSENHQRIQKIRFDILDAALKYVSTLGWTQEAIAQGAESLNYAGVAHGMFPNGAIELIHHFYSKCNRELIGELQRQNKRSDESGKIIEQPSPKDFAITAIRLRLEMIIPYKETWPQALAIMTLPQNVPTSLAQLLTLVDDICYCAGDQSVDIGWYTRRIGIASIYKMVELYLLQDNSPGHQQTWDFLERRMDEGIQIQEFLSTSDQKTKTVAKALGSAFQTARNILGLNCDKR